MIELKSEIRKKSVQKAVTQTVCAYVPGDRVAVVDDGDGLDEDGGDEVGGAEVCEDDVDGGVEERLPLADGDEDDEVEEDAEEGQRHLHHHHAGALPAGRRR